MKGFAEPDADPADGGQVPGLGRRLTQLAAQPGQVHVDRLVRAAPGLVPHVGEQLPLGHHVAGTLGQVGQQVELARAQVQHRLVEGGAPSGDVDLEPADDERATLARTRRRTAHHRPDARLQLGRRVRLDHVVVGTRIEGADQAGVVVAGTGDDDRHVADRAQHRQHLGAVDVGQAEVEDDQVGSVLDGLVQAVHAGAGGRPGVPALAEGARRRQPGPVVVLDDQRLCHRG